jgi:hypothetical protein
MESLPLMLQGALLLLGLALSLYLWTIFTRVSVVIIFFTSFGVVFYVVIIICGTLWYDCPFQTPVSTVIHTLLEYDDKHSQYISAIYKRLHSIAEQCSSMVTWAASQFRRHVSCANVEAAVSEVEPEGPTEMQNDPTPLFTEEKDINWTRHIADARCIRWMQEKSTDTDVAIATTRFISEVEWHSGIVVTPSLDKLWNDLESCSDPARLSDRMIVQTKDKAYVTMKALVHLCLQRPCVISSTYHFISNCPPILERDDQISITLDLFLGFIGHGGGRTFRVPWLVDHVPRVSIQHLAWMLHIFIYKLRMDERRFYIGEFIHPFIRKVLEGDHSQSILTDCFLVAGLMIGMPVHINDLMVVDKRCACVLKDHIVSEEFLI